MAGIGDGRFSAQHIVSELHYNDDKKATRRYARKCRIRLNLYKLKYYKNCRKIIFGIKLFGPIDMHRTYTSKVNTAKRDTSWNSTGTKHRFWSRPHNRQCFCFLQNTWWVTAKYRDPRQYEYTWTRIIPLFQEKNKPFSPWIVAKPLHPTVRNYRWWKYCSGTRSYISRYVWQCCRKIL